MSVHPLPQSIQEVKIPEFFAISRLSDIESCALSVFGLDNELDLLPPEPRALFGTLLHHLSAEISSGRWGSRRDGGAFVRVYFPQFVADLEEQLGASQKTARLLPLKTAVGRRRWNDGLRLLTEWASRQQGGGIEPPRPLVFGSEVVNGPESKGPEWNRIGIEKPVRSESLRLVGRPDFTEIATYEVINVIDFKSGRVTDSDGNIYAGIVLQLQAYALVLEAAYPEYEFNLFVEGSERLPVTWGSRDRESLIERLGTLSAEYPAGENRPSGDLASPGPSCGFCRLRHRCPAYREEAPKWWREGGPERIPLDTWGLVEEKADLGSRINIRLRDASGRRVLIEGLAKEWELDGIDRGDELWCFELESGEMTYRLGPRPHPRNFHEHPSGTRGNQARRLAVFARNS